jgi:hypothetical protein
MKLLDLFIGLKTEQSLRDLVRNASETSLSEDAGVELYPVGKKDWIAGGRLPEETTFATLRGHQTDVLRRLIAMKSHQRIRQDGLRIYAVHPPVPVFREPVEDSREERGSSVSKGSDNGVTRCPNCGAEVHPFNLLFGPHEKIVGCYLCRGEKR